MTEREEAAAADEERLTDGTGDEAVAVEETTPPEEPLVEEGAAVEAEGDGADDEAEVTPEQLLMDVVPRVEADSEVARKLAVLEAIIYVTDEPLSAEQISKALGEPLTDVRFLLDQLVDEYSKPHHGLTVRELAGGYKMTTKPEYPEGAQPAWVTVPAPVV